jgi:hypothetical protein
LFVAVSASAGGRNANYPWGAGAFNTNYRPAGSIPAHTPDWRVFQPSWRGGFLSFPNARRATPVVVSPYTYFPSYYPPYGSPYYGFQPTEPEPQPEPAPPSPPQVIVFPAPQQPAPEPAPAPQPQVVVVQVPVPTPPPEPVQAPAPVAAPPVKPSPPREVFHWVDADGVHHYSTHVPAGVKADKVGPK